MAGDNISTGSSDADVQKKAIKLIVYHLRKKVDPSAAGTDRVCKWLDEMDALLETEGFERSEYISMRNRLNDAIEWVFDVELRQKLRNSWYSYGKALNKKAKPY